MTYLRFAMSDSLSRRFLWGAIRRLIVLQVHPRPTLFQPAEI